MRRILAIIGIGLGMMILGMLWSIVQTALASIQKDLAATILHLQWMMNSFGLCICVPLLTMGKLGDSYGRKRLFLIGLVGVLTASILAGFAHNINLLIACMGLFGLSGSIILPLSQALLVHQFPESQKEKAVGLWSIFASLSLAIGPLVGGVILSFLGWRWIYLINVPAVCIVIPIVYFFVEKEKKGEKPHCDWGGVILLAMIVGSLIIAIMQGPSWGWNSPSILGLFALTIASLCAFIALERRTVAPLFRPDLFSQSSFLFCSIANGCMIGFIWVTFFMIPLYLQNVKNYSPFETGLILLLATLPVALLSAPVSKLYGKWGPKPLMLSGFSFLILASLTQAIFISVDSFWPVGFGCFCLGMGWVLGWGPSISCAISSLPHRLAGLASGMFTTLQELGAILSLAIAGVIFRQARGRILEPHMDQIKLSLQEFSPDKVDSLLSDPIAFEQAVGTNSPLIKWVEKGFITGYQEAFWYLLALSLFAILMTSFLKPRKGSKSPLL